MPGEQNPRQRPDQDTPAVATLIALYTGAETVLLAGVARILKRGIGTYTEQVAALRAVGQLARQVSFRLAALTPKLIQDVADETARAGAEAQLELIKQVGFDFSLPHGQRAAAAIVRDLTSELQDVRYRITRLPDDVYKAVVGQVSQEFVNSDTLTPATAQAKAFQQFLSDGVTGFTDKSGRKWSMSAYTEMAVRTAATRAFNDSHLQVMTAAGINLVTVSSDGHPCPLCFPWQGRVCCIIPDGEHPTIADAIAAGLFHPNCRHSWIAVIPGVTHEPAPQEWTPAHQTAYQATQKQRALERNVRKAKRQLQFAQDGDSAHEAKVNIRTNQQKLRNLTGEHSLPRQSRREQPDMRMSAR